MQSTFNTRILKQVRFHTACFMALLFLSGITAFPLRSEIEWLAGHADVLPPAWQSWIAEVHHAIMETPDLMFYGTDWLAFGHIVIGLFFVPVLIDPVRYALNLKIGLVACLLVFPLAFICGPIRGIPFFHQLVDCGFGVLGGLYLLYIQAKIRLLQKQKHSSHIP